MAKAAGRCYLSLVEVAVAVRATANPVRGWMESFPGRESTSGTVERAHRVKVAPPAIRAKPLYVPFPVVLVRGGKAARGRSSAVAVAVASSAEAAAARRRASRAGVAAVRPSPMPPYVGTSSFYKEWTTSRAA